MDGTEGADDRVSAGVDQLEHAERARRPHPAETTRTPRRSTAALRLRDFRMLLIGRSFSAFGDRIVEIALVFAVIEISRSAAGVALVLAVGLGPQVLLTLVGGVFSDRLPATAVMIVADVVRAATQITVCVLLWTGTAQLWQLAALSAVSGVASAFFAPASTGLVAAVVPAEHLQSANGWIGLFRNSASILGPAAAGGLVAWGGTDLAYLVDGLTFVISALALARVVPSRGAAKVENFARELAAGWREVRSRPWLRWCLVYFAAWNFAIGPLFVLGPILASEQGQGAARWGIVMTGGAAGMIFGGGVVALVPVRRPLFAALPPLLLMSAETVLVGVGAPLVVLVVGMAAGMGALTVSNSLWNTALQRNVPHAMLARVSSYDWAASFALLPAGYVVAAPLADAFGATATLAVCGVGMAVLTLVLTFSPAVRSLR